MFFSQHDEPFHPPSLCECSLRPLAQRERQGQPGQLRQSAVDGVQRDPQHFGCLDRSLASEQDPGQVSGATSQSCRSYESADSEPVSAAGGGRQLRGPFRAWDSTVLANLWEKGEKKGGGGGAWQSSFRVSARWSWIAAQASGRWTVKRGGTGLGDARPFSAIPGWPRENSNSNNNNNNKQEPPPPPPPQQHPRARTGARTLC